MYSYDKETKQKNIKEVNTNVKQKILIHDNNIKYIISLPDESLLDIAKKLEEVALNDEYFVKRGLYPNVDFYSGIIYRALGFPTNMFTVMFALGRLPGWIAHWREMILNPKNRINRPRQIYTGRSKRNY